MSFILGLDVGTASGAGATKRDGRVQPCALGDRTATVPAVVVLHDDGTALVGEEAERVAGLELTRVARSLRHDPVLQLTPITVGGEVRTPHELLRTLYSTMVQRVRAIHGALPTHVVLTHPAVPEGVRCDAVERIADDLFPGAAIVPEPVAATVKLACDAVLPTDCTVAVYDFGGGTFDCSLVQRLGDRFSILGDPAGLADFGGIDADDLILDHVDRSLDGAIARIDLGDPAAIRALTRLRAECRDAKERLSYDNEVTIDASLPNLPALVHLTRAEFEAALYPHLEVTVDVLLEMIDRSGARPSDVDAVALIGGSSRIPAVAEIVSARTGMQVLVDPYPELTVALGAAQMVDDEAPSPSVFPFADLDLPSLDNLGPAHTPQPVGAYPEFGYGGMPGDQVETLSAVGTAVAERPYEDTGATLLGLGPRQSVLDEDYDLFDDEFDVESRSRFAELMSRLNVRPGAVVLSAIAGVVVIVAGALALGGGGGGSDDATRGNGDSIESLGSDSTTGDGSAGHTSSSAKDSTSSSSSSSSSTTADDEDDDSDGSHAIRPRPSTTDRQGESTSTSRPGTSTSHPRGSTSSSSSSSTTSTTEGTTSTTDGSTTSTTDGTTSTTDGSTTTSSGGGVTTAPNE